MLERNLSPSMTCLILKMSLRAPKGRGNDKEGCLKYNTRDARYEIFAKISDFLRP